MGDLYNLPEKPVENNNASAKPSKRRIVCMFLAVLGIVFVFTIVYFIPNSLNNVIATGYFAKDNLADYKCPDCNVILISIDTLRADHLGIYGYERNTSPNIDKFASENIMFTNFYTVMPTTNPAMASVFSGKYPNTNKLVENGNKIPSEVKLLAELISSKYTKVAFVANPTLAGELGFSRGFDSYTLTNNEMYANTSTSEIVTNNTIEWLKSDSKKKFFLWVHYLDPHGPYTPPDNIKNMFVNDSYYDSSKKIAIDYEPTPGINENYVFGAVPKYQRLDNITEVDYYVSQYDAEIYSTDQQIGLLLDYLKDAGLYDKSIIIITADHGESLGENNYYFGHGIVVNDGVLRIPLIIKHPQIKSGQIIDSLLQNVDLFPTILAFMGINSDEKIEGINFANYLIQPGEGRMYAYARTAASYPILSETIINKSIKLVRSEDKISVYNLTRKDIVDISASIPLYEKNKLIEALDSFNPNNVSNPLVEYKDADIEALKALGYVN